MSKNITSEEKIKKPADFKFIAKKGKRYSTKNLTVNILKKKSQKPRLGITIPNRVEKSAVKRNKTRRLIREFFRLNKNLFKSDSDYSFYVRKNVFVSYEEIKKETLDLLEKQKTGK